MSRVLFFDDDPDLGFNLYPSTSLLFLYRRYDVQILIADLIQAFSIHSNDVLLSSSWEISEYWMKKYWFCISNDCLSMSNRWRILRGELPLEMNDLLPQ